MKITALLLLPLIYGLKIELQADDGRTIFCIHDQSDDIYLAAIKDIAYEYTEEDKELKQILSDPTFSFTLNDNVFQFTHESAQEVDIDHGYLSYNGSTDFGIDDTGRLVLSGSETTKLKVVDISTI